MNYPSEIVVTKTEDNGEKMLAVYYNNSFDRFIGYIRRPFDIPFFDLKEWAPLTEDDLLQIAYYVRHFEDLMASHNG
jgi:hypothetical protein